jgi:hypothetical protein
MAKPSKKRMDEIGQENLIKTEGECLDADVFVGEDDNTSGWESLWFWEGDYYRIVDIPRVTKIDVKKLEKEEGDDPSYFLQLIRDWKEGKEE